MPGSVTFMTDEQEAAFNAESDAAARWGWGSGGGGGGSGAAAAAYGFVIPGVPTNHDPVSGGMGAAGAVASHYYQGYWAGVQGAMYGFGGALAGAALFGAFAPEAAAFEIIAAGAHIGAAIGQHFAGPSFSVIQGGLGAGTPAPPAPPAPPGFSGPPNFPGIVDGGSGVLGKGITWSGFPPGYLPDAGGEPLVDTGWNDLSARDQARIALLSEPNIKRPGEDLLNWLSAMYSGQNTAQFERWLNASFIQANSVPVTFWQLPIGSSRVPVFSDGMVAGLNAGAFMFEPIGSYSSTMQPNGLIQTDTSKVLPLDITLGWDYGPFR